MKMLSVVFAIVIAGCAGDEGGVATLTAAVEGDSSSCFDETFDACVAEYTDDGNQPADGYGDACAARAADFCASQRPDDGGGTGAGDCYSEVFLACFELCIGDGDDDAYCPEACRLRAAILCGAPDDCDNEPRDERAPREDEAQNDERRWR